MKRRDFLLSLSAATAASTLSIQGFPAIIGKAKPREFPPLPYAENALAPVISAQTVNIHYNKHHKGYFDPVNKLTAGTPLAEASFEEIIMKTYKDKANINSPSLFNMASQVWNHTFYWNSLTPNGGGSPAGKMLDKINQSFGDYDNFKKLLTDASISTFGSGWSWLVADKKGKLLVVKTEDADNPMTKGLKPLLTIDVWEHAYYLDYQNKRADYVKALIEKLLNWEFAAKNLG
jgi:Fe-Mn family superoxide dismutase